MMNSPVESALENRVKLVENEIVAIKLDIDGNAFKDILGMRQRIRNVEHEVKDLRDFVEALKEERAAEARERITEKRDNARWRRLILFLIALIAAMACATLLVQFFYLMSLPR